jgi:hypothetical protein
MRDRLSAPHSQPRNVPHSHAEHLGGAMPRHEHNFVDAKDGCFPAGSALDLQKPVKAPAAIAFAKVDASTIALTGKSSTRQAPSVSALRCGVLWRTRLSTGL